MTHQFTNPIHLYRGLLRETTYLFDPVVRTYIHTYVNKSFRAKIAKEYKNRNRLSNYKETSLPDEEERHHLKRGRKFLSILQRANHGHKEAVSNVIKLAYGRKGRKRRELMSEIMTRDDAADERTRAHLISAFSSTEFSLPVTARGDRWVPPSKFFTLLQSQAKIQQSLDTNRKLKPKPEIPLLNRKGVRMPKSRTKNMTQAWYAVSARFLFPYLSTDDHEALQERVEGRGFLFPQRRPIASVLVFSKPDSPIDNGALHLLQGALKPRSKRQRVTIGKPHKLNVRFLRRIYEREVWRNTPMAILSDQGTILNLHWDDGQKRLPCTRSLPEGNQSSMLFG